MALVAGAVSSAAYAADDRLARKTHTTAIQARWSKRRKLIMGRRGVAQGLLAEGFMTANLAGNNVESRSIAEMRASSGLTSIALAADVPVLLQSAGMKFSSARFFQRRKDDQ